MCTYLLGFTLRPPRYARYAGTRGNTHGLRNVTVPAMNETSIPTPWLASAESMFTNKLLAAVNSARCSIPLLRMSTPRRMRSTPKTICTARKCLLNLRSVSVNASASTPTRMKGTPIPRLYASSSQKALAGLIAARVSIAPSIAPMHGLHPAANATPNKKLLMYAYLLFVACTRRSCCRNGMRSSPVRYAPNTIIIIPPT